MSLLKKASFTISLKSDESSENYDIIIKRRNKTNPELKSVAKSKTSYAMDEEKVESGIVYVILKVIEEFHQYLESTEEREGIILWKN